MQEVEILITKCRETAVIPAYARSGDAGMDVSAAVETIIRPGQTTAVPTGLKVAIPEGYELQVRPRSGISLNTPLRISNSPGTIDSGFRDEVRIIISNTSRIRETDDAVEVLSVSSKGCQDGVYRIMPGDRIAQFVLQKVPVIKWKEVPSLDGVGIDRNGGFGSTGTD
jgi:dUTP pyrophosphatase